MNEFEQLRKEILEKIALEWNRRGIKYAVCHGLEGYPISIGRDLDVIVNRVDKDYAIQVALNVFRLNGWRCVVHRKPWAVWITAFCYYNGQIFSVELDLLWELRWAWVSLVNGLGSKLDRRGPFVIDLWAYFVKSTLTRLLKGDVSAFLDRLIQYEENFENCIVDEHLRILLGYGKEEIIRLVSRGKLWKLKITLLWRFLIKKPWPSAVNVFGFVRDKIALYIRPRRAAPIVAVIGVRNDILVSMAEAIERRLTFPRVLLRQDFSMVGLYFDRRRGSCLRNIFQLVSHSIQNMVQFVGVDLPASAKLQLVVYCGWLPELYVKFHNRPLWCKKLLKVILLVSPKPDIVIWCMPEQNEDLELVGSQLFKDLSIESVVLISRYNEPERIVEKLIGAVVEVFGGINECYDL